jgi:hypothetical protein
LPTKKGFSWTAEKSFSVNPNDGINPTIYSIREKFNQFYSLRDIKCYDHTGDTSVDLVKATANIKVSVGEIVACTFWNYWDGRPPI